MRRLILTAIIGLATTPAFAQGLMSGTGMQPSQQLATPPDTPAIDRPSVHPAPAHQARPHHTAKPKPAASDSTASARTPR